VGERQLSGAAARGRVVSRTAMRGRPRRIRRSCTRRPSTLALALGVTLAFVAGLARVARADETPAEAEVEVRGGSAAGFVSRRSLEDAPREVTDAASLIEPLPGVHVRRLGADDSFATLSVRGTSSTQVAVYLAGVPLTGGADPTLDLSTLPLWPGARASVFRSFAPAALGRGSLGGTLVIDAPSPRGGTRTEIWTAAGAFGSRRLRIGDVRGPDDGVRISTGLSASRSDDDFSYVDRVASRGGPLVLTDRDNAGHAAASGLVSVAVPVALGAGRSGALTTTTLLQGRRQQLPGTATLPTVSQRLDSSRVVEALELTLPAGQGAFGLRAWGRREGLSISDSPREAIGPSRPTATDDVIVAAGSSVGWKGRPTEALSIETRIDGSAERFAPGTWVGAAPPPGARRSSAGAAFDGTLRAGPRTTLAASSRIDAWFESGDGPAMTRRELRPTGNVGLETRVGPVALASHGGLVARPPSFVERYGNRGGFIGDADLRPESAFTIDGGARIGERLGPLRLHLEATLFGTWADDLIVFVPRGADGRAKATNIGTARLLGTETELRLAAHGIELRASHTGLSTRNLSACRFERGACVRPSLPGRPQHDFVGDLAYSRGPFRVRYGVDVVAGISADDDDSSALRVPDRVLHSAGLRVDVPGVPGLSVSFDVRNLFDLRVAEYPNALGGRDRYPIGDLFDYPLPGRRILLSARWVSAPPPSPTSPPP